MNFETCLSRKIFLGYFYDLYSETVYSRVWFLFERIIWYYLWGVSKTVLDFYLLESETHWQVFIFLLCDILHWVKHVFEGVAFNRINLLDILGNSFSIYLCRQYA